MRKLMTTLLSGLMLITVLPAHATRFLGIHVIDKQYLMLHFRDGEVHYRDNGTGPSATRPLPMHSLSTYGASRSP